LGVLREGREGVRASGQRRRRRRCQREREMRGGEAYALAKDSTRGRDAACNTLSSGCAPRMGRQVQEAGDRVPVARSWSGLPGGRRIQRYMNPARESPTRIPMTHAENATEVSFDVRYFCWNRRPNKSTATLDGQPNLPPPPQQQHQRAMPEVAAGDRG